MCSETGEYMISTQKTIGQTYNIDRNLSIYISHIDDEHANEEYIRKIFYTLNIGIVSHIHFQDKNNLSFYNNNGKIAVIYMQSWFNNIIVENIQSKMINKNSHEARIVHDDPLYWVLEKNEENQYMNIDTLEQKNIALESTVNTLKTTVEELKWWIRVHDGNINYLSNKFTSNIMSPITSRQSSTTDMAQLSNVDTFDSVWTQRLRERL